MTPSKRGNARQADSPPSSMKKRKQLTMDDYVGSVFSNLIISNPRVIYTKIIRCLTTATVFLFGLPGEKEKVKGLDNWYGVSFES